MTDPTPIAGLVLGLAGSTHCVAMCGGVASALDRAAEGEGSRRIVSHLLYAVGRLSSYALFGALAGSLGFVLADVLGPGWTPRVQLGARVAVGLLLIALGLALAGWRPLRGVERMGLSFWRRLRPLSRRITHLPLPLRTLALGALWGFLPCGLVYGAAAVATATGSAGQGAVFMAAFGLGTVPAVLGVGAFTGELWSRLRVAHPRRVSAVAVALCGVWVLVGPSLQSLAGHAHH